MRFDGALGWVPGLAIIAAGLVGCSGSHAGGDDGADAAVDALVDGPVDGPVDAGPLEPCDRAALRGDPLDTAQPGFCARMGGAYVSTDAGEVRVDGHPFADLDGDGVDEFIVNDCGDGPCIVRGGDSAALLQPGAALASGTAFAVPWTRPAGDLDGDGLIDLAFVEQVQDEVWLRVRYGAWPWRDLGVDILLEVYPPDDGTGCPRGNLHWSGRPVGDLDGGGSDDLMITRTCGDEHGGSGSVIMHGEDLGDIAGAGLPPRESPGVTTLGGKYLSGVASGDFNGDGVLDLALGQYPDPLNADAIQGVSLSGVAILWGPIGAGRVNLDTLGPWPSDRPLLAECLTDGIWIDVFVEGGDLMSDGDLDDDGFDDLVLAPGPVYVIHGGPELEDVAVDSSHANISSIDIAAPWGLSVVGVVPACPDEGGLPALAVRDSHDLDAYHWIADGAAAMITASEFGQRAEARCRCQR